MNNTIEVKVYNTSYSCKNYITTIKIKNYKYMKHTLNALRKYIVDQFIHDQKNNKIRYYYFVSDKFRITETDLTYSI